MATIIRVVGRLLRIHFDGWEALYDQWMDCLSPDIYPLGWSEIVGHPLDVPQDAVAVGPVVDKKKSKASHFRGSRKKRRSKAALLAPQVADSPASMAADQVSMISSTSVRHAVTSKDSPHLSPALKKIKLGETCDVTSSDDAVVTSPHISDNDEMPKLSPPDGEFKLQAAMPDLSHSGS